MLELVLEIKLYHFVYNLTILECPLTDNVQKSGWLVAPEAA